MKPPVGSPSKVWDRPRKTQGKVIGVIYQRCSVCGCTQGKIVALWPDGHKTYLCPRAIESDSYPDIIHII